MRSHVHGIMSSRLLLDHSLPPLQIRERFSPNVFLPGFIFELTMLPMWCINTREVMYMALKRKQIYLDSESDRTIKKLARITRLPEAEHIRRAVADYLRRTPHATPGDQVDPLLRLIGICDSPKGPKDAALRHDTYLYGSKS